MQINLIGKGPVFDAIIKESKDYKFNLVQKPLERPGHILVCSGYSKTITNSIVCYYQKGVINIHTSLLPKYRGRHPVDWAMEHKEKEIGITIHYIQDETIDTGDIIIQDSVPYSVGEGYDSVMKKICGKVPLMLNTVLKQIEFNCVYRRKQNEEVASYYPKRTKPRIY